MLTRGNQHQARSCPPSPSGAAGLPRPRPVEPSGSVPLGRPTARTPRIIGVAGPAPPASIPGHSPRARGELARHSNRDAHRAFAGDAAAESYKVGMKNHAVPDINLKVVGGIAGTARSPNS